MNNSDYLNEFVYDSKLRDLNIFSKQYFNSILYSMYKEVPEDDLLCFTFGDFNKLNKINKQYSYKAGDDAIKTSFELIRATLPPDTIIARIAGDEFCFLNPNMTKKEMDKAFKKVDDILNENKENNYGLTITTSSIDSTIFSNFDDMYAHTELSVTRKKKSNNEKNQSLSEAIHNGLANYFSYYRIEANSLPKEYYSVLKNSIIDLVIHNLEKPNPKLAPYMEKLKQSANNLDFESRHLEIEPKLASGIHDFIVKQKSSLISRNTEFNKLFKFLVTDPLTGQISKNFFDKAVLPSFADNMQGKLSVRLFDLAHLKLSNDVIGHNPTDEKINELYTSLVTQIKSDSPSGKYFASAGNCGLLLIEHADSAIKEDKINAFLSKSLADQPILGIATASRVCSPCDITKTIAKLDMECKVKKERSKLNKIKRKQTILPLQLALKDSIHLYMKTTPNPHSIENKQKLVMTIFDELTQVINEQFPNQQSNIFSNADSQER